MKAEYIDHLGNDLRVVNAARVSFDKESAGVEIETYGVDDQGVYMDRHIEPTEADSKLIRYLARYNHFTPFTHPQITLRETVPIFVARQRFKHMVGFTYNEVSRRYVDSEPEFYVPEVWRKRPEGSVKQGSSHEAVDRISYLSRNSEGWGWTSAHPQTLLKDHHAASLLLYKDMLNSGVCPEQARMVLPQSMMTSYYVTGSLAAFARAYAQRSDAHAQLEIQVLAKEWDKVIRPLFPVSWSALTDKDSI